jgi:holo-[acyl-carrier protein] synthase
MADDSLTTGIDLIEIDRIQATIDRFGRRFLDRIFTEREQRYCRGRVERLAGRFAVKEAVSKVLGIGIRRIRWRDIEVLPNREGKPEVYLHSKAETEAAKRGISEISVSITHSRMFAAAIAVGIQRQADLVDMRPIREQPVSLSEPV